MNTHQDDLIHKRRVIAILRNKELVEMASAKLYTANEFADHWLDSGLEGYLCFCTDYETKSRYIIMYSYHLYEKLFEIELYNNFNNYYQILTENFHCFEYGDGFIGFMFSSLEHAKLFNVVIQKFNDKLLQMMMSGGSVKKDKRDLIKKNINIVKSKFSSTCKYDSKYIENNEIFITKPRYFELLGNIDYDKEKKQFIITEKDTKDLLKSAGISKNSMKDTSFALTVFRLMIEGLEKELDSTKIYSVKRKHKYPNGDEIDTGMGIEKKEAGIIFK